MLETVAVERQIHVPAAPVPAAGLFSDAELASLHDGDKRAGGSIVAIMTTIFTVALVMYLFIAALAFMS